MSVHQPGLDQSVRNRPRWPRGLEYVLAAIVLLACWLALMGPWSTDIRLDTGDLRYRLAGIPIYYERMPEPERSKLLDIARRSLVKSEWSWLAPQMGSNSPTAMCRSFYLRMSAWIDEDPAMAVMIAQDLAQYIQRTHAKEALPETFHLLMCTQSEGFGGPVVVRPDWRDDPHVREYFARTGQVP